MNAKTPLLIILGPTASGKTHLATRVAAQLNGEILSADSRQVYRQMDIGTGKDLDEYTVNGQPVPYHLINIRDAGAQYNVNDFQHDFAAAYAQIAARAHCPIVCGGTGFYIYALLKGHAFATVPVNEALRESFENQATEELLAAFHQSDSPYHALADTSTRKRLVRALEIAAYLREHPDTDVNFGEDEAYPAIIFGLDPPVETRRQRISTRLDVRLKQGLIKEVENLLSQELTPDQLIYYGLEYKYLTLHLTGQMSYAEMQGKLETEIHRFAKRQMTFFRKMEKDGLTINWIPDEWSEPAKIGFIIRHYREFIGAPAGNM